MQSEIVAWSESQIKDWSLESCDENQYANRDRKAYFDWLDLVNGTYHDIFIFDFYENQVSIRPKDGSSIFPPPGHLEEVRCAIYLEFIKSICSHYSIFDRFSIALCVGDLTPESNEFPIFGLQKKIGSRTILIPDPEFMTSNFYCNQFQEVQHKYKRNKIIFCGSSTGMMLDTESVINDASERLYLAARFDGNPDVLIKIGAATQCLTADAVAMLHGKPYFQPLSWSEQLMYKALLSIDGNGATCSRVVLALKSQSVLLKYQSKSILYYHAGLIPWKHFIPVCDAADLDNISDLLIRNKIDTESIVRNANIFFEDNLRENCVKLYMYYVLKSFAVKYFERGLQG